MKNRYLLPVIIALIFAVIYSYCFDSKLDINGDNAMYIKLAENMSEGLGYSTISPDGTTPASHFPPGYSAILSIPIYLGFNNLILFKVLNGLFLLCSLLLMYYVVKGVTDNRALAFSSIVLTILSPKLINFAFMAMSEMSYLLMCAIVLFSLYKFASKNATIRSPYFWMAIVAAVLSYYIRTVGASLMFGIVVFYAFRCQWKELFISAGSIVLLLLPWSIRNSMMGIESRYLGTIMTVNPWRPEEGSISTFGEMFSKMATNFDETVIKGFRELLFPYMEVNYRVASSFPMIVFGLVILGIVLYGAWKFGKLRYFMLAFFAANIGLFLLWHGGNGSRYVVPVTPFIFACFWVGIYHLLSLKVKLSPYFYLLAAIPMFSSIGVLAKNSRNPYPPAFVNYFKIAESIERDATKGLIICCRKPELLGFYAKKVFAINYSYTLDNKELIQNLIDQNVDYVLLDNLGFSSTPRYLYPAISNNNELFPIVMQLKNPDTYLLKFDKEKAIEKFSK